MADFTYAGSGTIRTRGCTKFAVTVCFYYKFAEGSLLYLCEKANKGILEKIVIKKVKLSGISTLYIDTFNALYNENELCTPGEAFAAATAYYEAQLAAAIAATNC